MARMRFGGGVTDFVATLGTGNDLVATGGATVTFWTQETGGFQYTDLQDLAGGALDHVTSSDGTDGRPVGEIAAFLGPDGVYEMWASANGSARALMVASNLGSYFGPVPPRVDAHIGGGANPHATTLASLGDVTVGAPTNQQALLFNSSTGKWAPGTVSTSGGGGGGVSLTGGSIIQVPNGDVTTQALIIRVPAGDRTAASAPDTFAVYWNSGTDAVPSWRRVGWFNENGEFRVQASSPTRVPLRLLRRDNTQTANLQEWSTETGAVQGFVTANGLVRAPNLGQTYSWSVTGNVTTGTGGYRHYNLTGQTLTIRAVRLSCGIAAPTGADIIIDVNKNGTTIFTTTANRPRITAGTQTSSTITNMDITTLEADSYLTVDIDQIGSTVAGSGLVVDVLAY